MFLCLALLQPTLAEAIEKTRSEPSFEVEYAGEGAPAGSDAFKRWGTGAWRAPGILVLQGEALGHRKELAVRAGVLHSCGAHPPSYDEGPCPQCKSPRRPTTIPRVWVYEGALQGWMKADEASASGAAQGAQNPYDLLGLLAPFADKAKSVQGGFEIALKGRPALDLVGTLVPGNWSPENAQVTVQLRLDDQGRVASLKADVALAGAQGAGKGSAEFKLRRFGQAQVPPKLGDDKAPVTYSAKIRAALDAELARPPK